MKLVLTLTALSLCAGLAMSAMADTTSTTGTTTTGTTMGSTTTGGTSGTTMGSTTGTAGTTTGTTTGTTGGTSTATTTSGTELTATECDKIQDGCKTGVIAHSKCIDKLTACQNMKVQENMKKHGVGTSTY